MRLVVPESVETWIVVLLDVQRQQFFAVFYGSI